MKINLYSPLLGESLHPNGPLQWQDDLEMEKNEKERLVSVKLCE